MTGSWPPRQPPEGVPFRPGDRPGAYDDHTPDGTAGDRVAGQPTPGRGAALLPVSHRLTARDRELALLLAEHRVLTTEQVAALLFATPGTARNRLGRLRRMQFVDRFSHRRPGRAPFACWVPGLLSARYAALAAGQPPPTPRAVRTLQDRMLANPQLDHLLGVNQFFSDLARSGRAAGASGRLVRWWSADRTSAAFAGRIHPDGHGLWQVRPARPSRSQDAMTAAPDPARTAQHGGNRDPDHDPDHDPDGVTVGFWLEHDTGSEPLARLLAKQRPYARLQDAGGPAYPLLFWLPSRRRELNLRRLLAADLPVSAVTIATALHGDDPAGACWRVAAGPGAATGDEERPQRLGELASRHGVAGPLNPSVPSDG